MWRRGLALPKLKKTQEGQAGETGGGSWQSRSVEEGGIQGKADQGEGGRGDKPKDEALSEAYRRNCA